MLVDKPASVANNPFRSAKWDELTAGRDFAPSDAPTLSQLSTMKQASAEIRQLNKQLGIDDEARPEPERAPVKPLEVIRAKYKGRGAASAG